MGGKKVKKVFRATKEVKRIQLDPYLETADVDVSNNAYPSQAAPPSRFELYKQNQARENPIQRAKRNAKAEKKN
jgi:hypothetical protein